MAVQVAKPHHSNRARWAQFLGLSIGLIIIAILVSAFQSEKPHLIFPAPTQSASPASTSTPHLNWKSTEYSKGYEGSVPPVPMLTGVETTQNRQAGYDSISFTFHAPVVPGYTAKYVSTVSRDGSGETVKLPGSAFLQLTFHPASAHDDQGASTLPSVLTNPTMTGFSELKSYVITGDFEGTVSVALGLDSKDGFRVRETRPADDIWVVTLDVRRP